MALVVELSLFHLFASFSGVCCFVLLFAELLLLWWKPKIVSYRVLLRCFVGRRVDVAWNQIVTVVCS